MKTMREIINLVETAQPLIAGLPAGEVIGLAAIEKQYPLSRYQFTAVPNGKDYRVHVLPKESAKATSYTYKPGRPKNYHDASLSHVVGQDLDEPLLAYHHAKLKAEHEVGIEPLADPNAIYRGMSFEEYHNFLETCVIKSRGEYNIGDSQKGLTYWAREPSMAASYANSFAPSQFKASFDHPAYIVAARRPEETRHVKGTDPNEVGVERAITTDEVLAVWEGRVYDFSSGEFTVLVGSDGEMRVGGGRVSPSAHVAWRRIA